MTTVSKVAEADDRKHVVAIDVSLSLLFAEELVLKHPETYLFILDANTLSVVHHPLISNPSDVQL